jgi:RNA polymerase sigma-70 factor (ECF subfamily)
MGAKERDARFRGFFERELPFVVRALRRLGVREADLADVAQDLFLAAFDRLDDLDPTSPPRNWLLAFCTRFAANYRRLARHRATDLDEHALVDRGEVTEGATRDLVVRALDALDFDQRLALVMHDLEGITAPEIAALTGTPLNTVYSRIRLAREGFRVEVDRLDGRRGGAS